MKKEKEAEKLLKKEAMKKEKEEKKEAMKKSGTFTTGWG